MEGYRLIEKFTPTEGGLVYYFRVEDPDYEVPYAGEMFWPRSDDHNYEFLATKATITWATCCEARACSNKNGYQSSLRELMIETT